MCNKQSKCKPPPPPPTQKKKKNPENIEPHLLGHYQADMLLLSGAVNLGLLNTDKGGKGVVGVD